MNIVRSFIVSASLLLASAAAGAAPAKDPLATAQALADWQLGRLQAGAEITRVTDQTRNPLAWEQAVFWAGMTALTDATGSKANRKAIMDFGTASQWKPASRPFFADDHVISQTWLWAANNGAGQAAMQPTRQTFDYVLANPPRVSLGFFEPAKGQPGKGGECLDRWCWCDALFMGAPVWLELARQTGDQRYLDYALKEFWATTDFLYDPAEHLFFRDSRFFERRDEKGRKLFWSRGNGWVIGGLARSIPLLPAGSPDRKRMEQLFVEMSAKLIQQQKPDGYWAPSLLGPEDSPPESSGTAFFTYGLAWGINAGLLDRATYEPAARRGWAALERSIQPDGRLGWVQQVSYLPEQVKASDTQYYGVGAFLLAATEIAKLGRPAGAAR